LAKLLVGFFKILPEKTLIGMMKKQIDKMVKMVPDDDKALSKAYFKEHFSGGVKKADVVGLFNYLADYHKNYGDVANRLESWPGKVLIMESDDDPRAPAKHRKALREAYPGAEVHTFHKAGHSVMLRYRDECITKIKQFLS
jgi:pimeloyl-ACP methyl ester carboxylesterase